MHKPIFRRLVISHPKSSFTGERFKIYNFFMQFSLSIWMGIQRNTGQFILKTLKQKWNWEILCDEQWKYTHAIFSLYKTYFHGKREIKYYNEIKFIINYTLLLFLQMTVYFYICPSVYSPFYSHLLLCQVWPTSYVIIAFVLAQSIQELGKRWKGIMMKKYLQSSDERLPTITSHLSLSSPLVSMET